jgi:hypothetical protein
VRLKLTSIKTNALISSQLRPGLLFKGLLLWVVLAGIVKFTVVVFVSKVLSDGVGDSQEVLHVNRVGDVGVPVVLEVLKHVHVLVDEVISSHSWEGEGPVVELPCVNLKFWGGTSLLVNGIGNVNNVGPVSGIESSGEHVDLVVEFSLSLIKVFAWLLELNKSGLFIGAFR